MGDENVAEDCGLLFQSFNLFGRLKIPNQVDEFFFFLRFKLSVRHDRLGRDLTIDNVLFEDNNSGLLNGF